MKCTSIEDIYLVLKSSDILAKELSLITVSYFTLYFFLGFNYFKS